MSLVYLGMDVPMAIPINDPSYETLSRGPGKPIPYLGGTITLALLQVCITYLRFRFLGRLLISQVGACGNGVCCGGRRIE